MKKSKATTKGKTEVSNSQGTSPKGFVVGVGDDELFSLDILTVKIISLRISDDNPRPYLLKVTFLDQVILCNLIKPVFMRSTEKEHVVLQGAYNYDPSDYEKMCLFADTPLIVSIHPFHDEWPHYQHDGQVNSPAVSPIEPASILECHLSHVSCCNVDILPLFTTTDKMCVKKRLEPVGTKSILQTKSWDNLPLVTMTLTVDRHEQSAVHHELLRNANSMKMTVVAAYNLMFPYRHDLLYTAATVLPMYNDLGTTLMMYEKGARVGRKFNCTQFYPEWESLRLGDDLFTRSDDKVSWEFDEIQNDSNIDLKRYVDLIRNQHTSAWASFHRTLLLGRSQRWVHKQIRSWHWPLEVHLNCEGYPGYGYSWMAFLNLFKLLYPGRRRVLVAVPLHWHNDIVMTEMSNCGPLLPGNEPPSLISSASPNKKPIKKASSPDTPRVSPLSVTSTGVIRPTGCDDNPAFIVIEVFVGHPLVREHIPRHISGKEIMDMLHEMEQTHTKRYCTGRGQSARDWKTTVLHAAEALRRVPHHGLTEFCIFNRQLSETRTRVELLNSFILDAAVYVNNQFVVQDYIDSEKTFEELLMMAHTNLMQKACETLVGKDTWHHAEPTLRAARHARHLQDIVHATELYMQYAAENPHNENVWRELGTCLRDGDRDWAAVCIDKAFLLDTRHPLSLICKACLVYEEDPDAAELFFRALIYLYPLWGTAWVIVSAYYHSRELYHMAEQVLECYKVTMEEHLEQSPPFPRAWEHELGDWWDPPPLLPGMSPFFDAADLLLRMRGITLAEVCIAIALAEDGESAVYNHMVALCCRLQGDIKDSLCHVQRGIANFGEVNYLRSLEGECLHWLEEPVAAMAAFDKAGSYQGAYSMLLSLPRWEPQRVRTVLVDLLRRQPSAYAWMALASDWMIRGEPGEQVQAAAASAGTCQTEEQTAALTCAAACAVQALKWDRRAGRAWALLARLSKPNAARAHYFQMATACGYPWIEAIKSQKSKDSLCYRLGSALKECRCSMCDTLRML